MDGPLPTGTLTLLFTDIEGSTRLLSRLGDRYAEVLSTQRTLLRAAFERWRGWEMGTEGDSFFVVFRSAVDAVNAAIDAQRALGTQAWPGGAAVRLRMGMHTGEPTRHEDGYIGMDVHRAARVASVACGGQVLVSDATFAVAGSRTPDGSSFLDLGWHRLKDVPSQRLFQLVAPGLANQFPPLKSLGSGRALPVLPGRLVGRERELVELGERITDDGVRLLTLTGPGGMGKTRLALATAAGLEPSFPDGVYFVPLESVESADVMWTTITEVLGVPPELRGSPASTGGWAHMKALIVLDNLEQLPGAPEVVRDVLAAGPALTVVATSRRPLHLAGEVEYPVSALDVPPPGTWGVPPPNAARFSSSSSARAWSGPASLSPRSPSRMWWRSAGRWTVSRSPSRSSPRGRNSSAPTLSGAVSIRL